MSEDTVFDLPVRDGFLMGGQQVYGAVKMPHSSKIDVYPIRGNGTIESALLSAVRDTLAMTASPHKGMEITIVIRQKEDPTQFDTLATAKIRKERLE